MLTMASKAKIWHILGVAGRFYRWNCRHISVSPSFTLVISLSEQNCLLRTEVSQGHGIASGYTYDETSHRKFSFWDRRRSSVSYAVLLASNDNSVVLDALKASSYDGISVINELREIWILAYPMIITYVLELGPGLTSLAMVGHLGKKETIDAAAFGTMFINMTAIAVGFGITTALDTLCSQAHGAQEHKRIGVYMQTATMIVLGICIPVFVLAYFSETCFLYARQDPIVSKLAALFVQHLVVGIPPLLLYEVGKKALQAQNIVKPMLYIAIIANIINVGVAYRLLFDKDVGGFNVRRESRKSGEQTLSKRYLGAAVARTIANYSMLAMLLAYVMMKKLHKDFWSGLRLKQAFAGVKEYFRLGIPGMLMMCFEWWAFELLAVMAGLLPHPLLSIGVHSVLTGVACLTFMLWLGVSVAASVRVGNLLGAGRPIHAKLAAALCVGLGIACSVLASLGLLLMRSYLPMIFSTDPDIVSLSAKTMFILMTYQIPDSINCVLQGVMRGCGQQTVGAWINLCSYYGVGLPVSAFLAFVLHWDIRGLWWGIVCGLFSASIVGLSCVLRNDWKALSFDAQKRTAISASTPSPAILRRLQVQEGESKPLLPRRSLDGYNSTAKMSKASPAKVTATVQGFTV